MTEFQLPKLDFAPDALAPAMSAETIEYHYGKHHASYVANLNALLKGSAFEGKPLEEIIRGAEGGLFNNAAQHFNHSFFWKCLTPNGGGRPEGALLAAIEKTWGALTLSSPLFPNPLPATLVPADLACEEGRRHARDRQHFQCGYAGEAGRQAAAHPRCVGACLLHRLPQCSSEVHRNVLHEACKLEVC